MGIGDAQLQQILSELNYLKPADLQRAVDRAASEHISLSDALLRSDLLSDQDLGKIIAYAINLPFVSLTQITIPDHVLKITPQEVAATHKAITFDIDEKGLKIATTIPENTDLFDMLAKKAGIASYRLFYATEHDVEYATRLYRKQLQAT